MADGQYYWLRLKRDFFKRHDIRIIEEMPNGKDYILFYLKLLCESVDHEGRLRFSEQIPYNDQMLATITNTDVDVVRSAVKVFSQLGMMELLDDGTYFMNEVQKMIGSTAREDNANRQKRFRERQKEKALQERYGNVTQALLSNENRNESKSIELDIDKEINIKKKVIKKKYGVGGNVLLTDEEYEKLQEKFPYDYEEKINNLSLYLGSTGKRYKSHYMTILSWANKDDKKPVKKKEGRLSFLDDI